MSRDLPFHVSDEERIAADMARELEAMTTTSPVLPGEEFAERVMLAIADEPLPQPVRAFGLALVGGHLRAAAAAIGDAWRTIASAPAPLAVRAQALALVLVVVVGSLTIAGGAAVGALGLLGNAGPTPPPSGPPSLPAPSTVPSPPPSREPSPPPSPEASPSESPEGSADGEATETPDANETAEPIDRHETDTPDATETDDHGGGDSSSGSGSGGDDHTPEPTKTEDHGSDG
jgi:hypothetical protein